MKTPRGGHFARGVHTDSPPSPHISCAHVDSKKQVAHVACRSSCRGSIDLSPLSENRPRPIALLSDCCGSMQPPLTARLPTLSPRAAASRLSVAARSATHPPRRKSAMHAASRRTNWREPFSASCSNNAPPPDELCPPQKSAMTGCLPNAKKRM